MLGSLFFFPYQTAVDATGVPLPGALLYFYQAGTDNPLNTYDNSALTVPNPNPVPANQAGVFAPIYIGNTTYKVVLTDQYGNQQWTADNCPPAQVLPQANIYYSAAGFLPATIDSSNLVQLGLGNTWVLTPNSTGRVSILVTGSMASQLSGGGVLVNGSFGTGVAPANGVAQTGTQFITGNGPVTVSTVAGDLHPFTVYAQMTGLQLAPPIQYWFDLTLRNAGSNNTGSTVDVSTVLIQEF